MASLGIRCGGNSLIFDGRHLHSDLQNFKQCSLAINCRGSRRARRSTVMKTKSMETVGKGDRRGKKNKFEECIMNNAQEEKMDGWMKEWVVEIVKNLHEAPLLVQVFSTENDDGETRRGITSLETEKTVGQEDWHAVRSRWEKGLNPKPEGIILVEELAEELALEAEGMSRRAWGVVVQGRSDSDSGKGEGGSGAMASSSCAAAPACYLLRTDTIGGGGGGGGGVDWGALIVA